MAITEERPPLELTTGEAPAEEARPLGIFTRPTNTHGWKSWLTTVDHKKIGIMYGVAAFFFFLVGGSEALLIRTQLAIPGSKLLSADLYNQMFTMHGVTMVFLVVMPIAAAFANYLLPLQIGARDVAFPRLNALSLWIWMVGRHLLQHVVAPRRRRQRRLVQLRAELRRGVLAEPRHRLLRRGPADHRHRFDHLRHQPDRHRVEHAGAGHDAR